MPKKKELPPHIENLKSNLDKESNLIDYFLLVGVPPSICLNDSLYENLGESIPLSKIQKEKSKLLVPEILSKCPSFDKNLISVDEGLINYCFPKGFQIVKSDTPIAPEYFSIILDNNFYSYDYPQKYISCLVIYESLFKYKELQRKIERVEKEIEKNNELTETKEENNMDKDEENNNDLLKSTSETSSLFNSAFSDSNTLKSNTDKSKNNELKYNYTNSNDSISLSTNDKLRSNNPNQINQSLYKSVSFHPTSNFYNPTHLLLLKKYYIPKCLLLVSIYPFLNLQNKILSNLYNYSLMKNNDIPIEKLILNFIIELPLPPRGIYKIDYQLMNYKTDLTQTQMNKLPLLNFSIRRLIKSLIFEDILTVLKHLILETKMLFFSESQTKTCEVILSFLNIIYPFKYPYQVTSYINKENYQLIESISPFIFGINEKYKSTFFTDNELEIEDEVSILCIDLDNRTISLKGENTFPNLPHKITEKITDDYNSIIKSKNFIMGISDINENEFSLKFTNIFFEFMVCLLGDYEKYLDYEYYSKTENIQNTNIYTLFNVKSYINSYSASDRPFYEKMVNDSQMFTDFIYKRMIPKNINEKIDILFISETLSKINKKNKQLVFLNSEDYDFIDTLYTVPKATPLTKNEKKYFNDNTKSIMEINYEFLKEYGQLINKLPVNIINTMSSINSNNSNSNSDIYDNTDIKFSYYLFPKMNFDFFLNDIDIKNYIFPPIFVIDIETVSSDLLTKCNVEDTSKSQEIEMKNYIYLTWLELWAFSYAKSQKKERKNLYDSMIKVLRQVIHHEMEVIDLLFRVLNMENDEEKIIDLYLELIKLKVNPSIYIHGIISKLIDKSELSTFKQIKNSVSAEKNIDNCQTNTPNPIEFTLKPTLKTSDTTVINQITPKVLKPPRLNKGKLHKLIRKPTIFTTFYNEQHSDIRNDFSKRTFKCHFEQLVLTENIYFSRYYPCNECGEDLDLLKITKDFTRVKKDDFWAFCENCKKYTMPKLTVNLGKEINKFNLMNMTSTCDSVVMYSPFHLKINLKDAILREFGYVLDLNKFKIVFNALFWNCIWYFYNYDMEFRFLLPYEDDVLNIINKLNSNAYIGNITNNNIDIDISAEDPIDFINNDFQCGLIDKIDENSIKYNSKNLFDALNTKNEKKVVLKRKERFINDKEIIICHVDSFSIHDEKNNESIKEGDDEGSKKNFNYIESGQNEDNRNNTYKILENHMTFDMMTTFSNDNDNNFNIDDLKASLAIDSANTIKEEENYENAL